jgi:predicted chitinase
LKGASTGGSPSGGDSGGDSGGGIVTEQIVNKVMSKMNYKPKPEYVKAIVSVVNSKMKDKNIAAMFLAQCAFESGGFQYIEEIACAGGNKCSGQYGSGAPGKSYHGRGFIQLSWPDNYKKAGQALGMGDKLYQDPDMVAKDPKLGAEVSIWFWKANVENKPGAKDHFGATTRAINGEIECKGSNTDKSKKRYEIYKAFVEEMKIGKAADESGCY